MKNIAAESGKLVKFEGHLCHVIIDFHNTNKSLQFSIAWQTLPLLLGISIHIVTCQHQHQNQNHVYFSDLLSESIATIGEEEAIYSRTDNERREQEAVAQNRSIVRAWVILCAYNRGWADKHHNTYFIIWRWRYQNRMVSSQAK